MPLDGYLQDLCLLTDDCLLPILDQETALINSSITQTPSCSWGSFELSPVTLEQMMQINISEICPANSKKTEHITPSLDPIVTPRRNTINNQKSGSRISSDTHHSNSSQAGKTALLDSWFDKLQPPSPTIILAHEPLQDITNVSYLPQHIYFSSNPLTGSHESVSKMDLSSEAAKLTLSQTTTLPPRSTTDVIADLKRQLHSSDEPSAKRFRDTNPLFTEAALLPLLNNIASETVNQAIHGPRAPENESEYHEDDDDEAEIEQPVSRPKKITERKRIFNAIADSWVQKSLLNPTKNSQVTAEEEGTQSTRWLVNQSENREIISTPREYQVELFERAKEKNVIAVLDTGLPIAVHCHT
jgi:hypothetical protein